MPHAAPETRHAILEAARRRYARFGPRKTTMEEVARDAGCSRATLYLHFGSKEALYRGLLAGDTERFLTQAEAVAAGSGSAQQKLRRLVTIALSTYERNHVLRDAFFGAEEMRLPAVATEVLEAQQRRMMALLSRVLEEGIAQGTLRPLDPERVAYLMYHLGHLLVMREAAGEAEYPLQEILGVMDDVFAHGIARAPGEEGGRS